MGASRTINRVPRASREDRARLAVSPDWSVDLLDPRNARYLRPLSVAADEEMAHEMAAVIYCSVAEEHADARRGFNGDEAYRQCLVNTRRMLRDRGYWELFVNEADFTPPLQ